MAAIEPYSLSAKDISQRVHTGSLSMRAVADFYVARTEQYAKTLNTHLHWDRADVMAQVAAQEARLKASKNPKAMPLAGVPVVVKDNICMRGVPTTCASKILEGFKPPYDAHVIERLRDAGAIFFGKANCDEFAMGSSNENSAYGPVRNPWDQSRVPGGSSGGSAAAVAADLAPVALGSDTGGSIRQPASLCGVVGLKPTYGRVSRYGLVAYGSSLDQIGPLTRSVEDAALVLDVIGGHDARDATSRVEALSPTLPLLADAKAISGVKIGLVREFFGEGLDEGTRRALTDATKVYEKLGATLCEVSLPYLKYSVSTYYLIATAEASANLARYDGVRYGHRDTSPGLALKEMYRKSRSQGFGREVKQRIMLGTFSLSSGYYDAYYAKANRARQLIAADFERAFGEVDLLLAPTWPTVAFPIGEKNQDPMAMYLSDICTLAVNLAGLPAISIPCGFGEAGGKRLPVGMQLIGPKWSEDKVLKGAFAYERATKWNEQSKPKL